MTAPFPAPEPTVSPAPPAARIGTLGWLALGGAVLAGIVYSVGLAVVLASTSVNLVGLVDGLGGSGGSGGSAAADPADPYYGYPGYEEGDSGYVLAQPSAEEARDIGHEVLEAAQDALGGSWTAGGGDYYEGAENSYGGPSLLHDFSTASSSQELRFTESGQKQDLVDALTAAVAPLGFDTVEVADSAEEWADAGYSIDGRSDVTGGDSSPLWIVTAYSSADRAPYLEFGIVEGADTAVRAGLDEWGIDAPDSGLYLQAYAWNLLEDGDRDAFTAAMEPFGGVEPYNDGTATT